MLADRGRDQGNDSGRPWPGPNPRLAAGRRVPERPWMINEAQLWSGAGADAETRTSGSPGPCGGAALASRAPRLLAHCRSHHATHFSVPGMEQRGMGRTSPAFPSWLSLSWTNASLQKGTFNVLPSVLCRWGGLCPSLPGHEVVSGDERRGAFRQGCGQTACAAITVHCLNGSQLRIGSWYVCLNMSFPCPGVLCLPAPEPQRRLQSTHAHSVLPPTPSPGLQGPC